MAHLRSILAIARKDALDVVLDRRKLGALVFPLVLALLWLLIIKVVVAQPISILVYNPTQSPLQQVVSGAFANSQITQASSPGQVSADFGPNGTSKKSSYDVGLTIPANFEQGLRAGGHPSVLLFVNGSAVSAQQSTLLQLAIVNYARSVAAPIPPVALTTATINPGPKPTAALRLTSYYSNLALALSFGVSLSVLPALLIEEKEKKTLRMLMVSPASFGDVLLGKLLVVLLYQLTLSLAMLAIFGAFVGNVPLLLLYVLLGICLALSLGLLLGTSLETTSAAAGIEAALMFVFIIPAIFVPLASYLSGNPITQIIRFFPTYYVAEGVYNALHRQGSFGSSALDVSVTLACILVTFLLTGWTLRRQAGVAATI